MGSRFRARAPATQKTEKKGRKHGMSKSCAKKKQAGFKVFFRDLSRNIVLANDHDESFLHTEEKRSF